MKVTVYPAPDADHKMVFSDVENLSFIDRESHGPARNVGVAEGFSGRTLIICSPNVTAVEIES